MPVTGEKKICDQVNATIGGGDDNANSDKEKASAQGQVNDNIPENATTGRDENRNSNKEEVSGGNVSDSIVGDGVDIDQGHVLDKNVPNNEDGSAKRDDSDLIQAQTHNYPANNRSVLYYHMQGNYFINIPIEPITPAVNTQGQCNSVTDGSAIQESTQVDHVANTGIVADDASRINNNAPRKTFKIFRDNLALTLRAKMHRRDGSSSCAELLPNLDNFQLQHPPDSVQFSAGNDQLAGEDSRENSTGNVQRLDSGQVTTTMTNVQRPDSGQVTTSMTNVQPPDSGKETATTTNDEAPDPGQGTTSTAGTRGSAGAGAGAGRDITIFRRSKRIKRKEGKK